MTELLAFALALESDTLLQSTLQGAAPNEECAVMFGERGPFLRVANGRPTSFGSLAGEPPPLPITFDFPETMRRRPAVATLVRARLRESGAEEEAERLVRALQSAAHGFAANDFRKLARWAPLLAVEAYRHTSVTLVQLDETRATVRRDPNEGVLRARWAAIHALSHSTLLATSAAPTTWLVEMATFFEWQTWTPSFPLVRERVLRLAVRGAWTAARFGTAVVDRYLRCIVDSVHLLRIFDAVLGATAIAAASPTDRSVIVRDVLRALRERANGATSENERLVIESCARSVSLVFDNPALADELTLQRGRQRALALGAGGARSGPALALFLAVDDEIDCAEIDGRGLLPSILAIPSIASAPADVFFASSAREERMTGDVTLDRVHAVFQRSVGIQLCSCGSGRPALECCAN
jgi:hypothetical protein